MILPRQELSVKLLLIYLFIAWLIGVVSTTVFFATDWYSAVGGWIQNWINGLLGGG